MSSTNISSFDSVTECLVRIAAAIAAADEATTRAMMERATGVVATDLVDEVILQSYLFSGFPRALNAARIWRAVSGSSAPADDPDAEVARAADWQARGERTCAVVYGPSYEMLRENIRTLHPALDAWMITDGYGKVLSRPQLDLRRRELCIVAACAASGQQRQLHSHLHGALNSGASAGDVSASLDSLEGLVAAADLDRYRALFARVLSGRQLSAATDQHPGRAKGAIPPGEA